MNRNGSGPDPIDELDLLRRLRQLPREREPAHDLWPGVRARLAATPSAPHMQRPRHRRRYAAWALAASLLLALGLGFGLRGMQHEPAPAPVADAQVEPLPPVPGAVVRFEAEAIAIEYNAAMAAFADTPLPPELQQAAALLDASAAQLRDALREQPDASYLLERLRHTYDQRLRLNRLALAS